MRLPITDHRDRPDPRNRVYECLVVRIPVSLTAPPPSRLSTQMHADDAAAVAQARGGDHDAFRLLGRTAQPQHLSAGVSNDRTCRKTPKTSCRKRLVRAFRQLGRFEARSNFATWLYRIGFNCAIDYMRARPHRESAEPDETLEQLSPSSSAPSIDDLVYAGEISERVQNALNALEPAGTRGVSDAALPRLFDRRDLRRARLEIQRRQAFDFPRGEKDARRAAAADGCADAEFVRT